MRRRQTIAVIALLGIVIIPVRANASDSSPGSGSGSGATVRLARLAPRIPSGATRLGRLASDALLTVTLVLRPTHTDELDALMRDLYDPSSSRYGRWLPTGEFVRRFGPDRTQVEAVTSWLHGQGLTDTSVQGMAVRASGDSQAVGRAFGVSFGRLRLAEGTDGYIASAAPLVPAAVADATTTILGLSHTFRFQNSLDATPRRTHNPRATFAAPRAAAGSPRVAAPVACPSARNFAGDAYWTSDQIGRFYNVNHLLAAGLTGQGRTIALLELGQSRASDTNAYLSCFGLRNIVKVKHIDGGANTDSTGKLEAEIDIQSAATQAPGATIVSYEAPNTATGEYDAYSQIVDDNRAQVVSTSWGQCEALLLGEPNGAAFVQSLHVLFQQAAAQGQSTFAASGDTGSEDCYDGTNNPPSLTLQVDNPADDPFVTGVGGTALEQPGVEPVWNDCEGQVDDACAAGGSDGAGGGESTIFPRPAWQPVDANAPCPTCRGVPDISANAGVGQVFYDSDTATGANAGWTAVGGTSISTPLLAGIAADIAQSCKTGRIGNFAPKVSALAAKHVYGTALTDVNHGINWTAFRIESPGNNDLTRNHGNTYKTAKGYDLASGLGVPIASGLACPTITSMTPNHGRAGTQVILHGVGLERATFRFGSVKAKVVSATGRRAVVIAPKGAGTVSVSGISVIGAGQRTSSFSYPGADSGSYRTASADGKIFNFGRAIDYGAPPQSSLHAPIVGMAVNRATGGYWLAAADGNVYSFKTKFYGDAGAHPLNQPIVGIAATKKGDGYWLVARDGGIFAFGNAHFYGSMGGTHLNQPIVGIGVAPRTGGYWLVASDGGIFTFHAPFHGSTGAIHLNRPIVGIAANALTGGYWLVASDGGVFAFHTPFYGSTGAIRLNRPIVGISATDDSRGYRFVASDGGVFNFGDARYAGSTSGARVAPVVAVTPAH